MNNSKRLTVHMNKGERIAGFLYLPVYLLLLQLALVLILAKAGWDLTEPSRAAQLNLIYFSVNFAVCLVMFWRFLLENLEMVARRFWGLVQAVILGWVLYMVLNLILSHVLNLIAPDLENVNDSAIFAMSRQHMLPMVVGTVLLAPLTEECLFRGLIFGSLYGKSRSAAYVISVLAFCMIHVAGYIGSYPAGTLALCALQYIPAGVALGWTYEKSDSVFGPILLHTGINALGMLAFGQAK